MADHTEGPWTFIDATKVAGMQFAPKCVIKAGDKQIASFSWNDNSPWFPTKDESQANARLIALAPELLDALKAANSWLERWAVHVGSCEGGSSCTCGLTANRAETARAIAKAEGRS